MAMNEQELKALVSRVIESVKNGAAAEGDIPVGISNRHIHLSREHVEILFGKGYQLTKLKDLSHAARAKDDPTVHDEEKGVHAV